MALLILALSLLSLAVSLLSTLALQGPLAGWTQQLVRAMTTAGEALEAEGSASLGDFVINCMKDCTAGGKPARAAALVSELVRPSPC